MSVDDMYTSLEAFIEQDQINWMGDGVSCQYVTVMMSDDMCLIEPAVCALTATQARSLAFELLVMAEHAERLTRHKESDR
jgi:hypothetical protein